MRTDSEYNTLLNKYNLLIEKTKNLQQTIEYKEKEYSKLRANNAISEKKVRNFCVTILAKDKNETVSEKGGTWNSLDMVDLIERTDASYKKNELERNQLMRQLMDKLELQSEENESLQQQISIMINRGSSGVTSAEELKKLQETQVALEKAKEINDLGDNIQTVVVEENDEEVDEAEMESINETIIDNAKTMTGSVYINNSQKKNNKIKNSKKNAKHLAIVDLYEKTKAFKESHWEILRIIGMGASRVETIRDMYSKIPNCDMSKFKACIFNLKSICLTSEKCTTPFTPNFVLYELSTEGAMLYEDRFGKKPERSEAERVKAEHTSLEHGYAILQIATMIHDTQNYKLSIFNRKNPIQINAGSGTQTFVPDFRYSSVKEPDNEMYIEYETGSCNYNDLCSKINKMFYCTNVVQIIVPSKDCLKDYIAQVDKYVSDKQKKNPDILKNKKIKICTAKWIASILQRTKEIPSTWEADYDFNVSNSPKLIEAL